MSKIINTTRDEMHPEWLMGRNPNAIEAQEALGQKQLVESQTLPVKGDIQTRAALRAAGVVFGDPVPGDPLFCSVTLPEGWKKVATDHSMWSDLVDAKGVKRAGIFYKAAFYDRDAFISAP